MKRMINKEVSEHIMFWELSGGGKWCWNVIGSANPELNYEIN
jgi:hypothetical protein